MPDNPTRTADDVEAWIAAWAPNEPADDHIVDTARGAVTAANPRTTREARNALRYAVAYLTHRHDAGQAVDPEAAFTGDAVDHYRHNVLNGATGTTAAVASHLKRLHPAVGFAGTTRTNAAGEPVHVPPTPLQPEPAKLDGDVVDIIAAWTPTTLHPERWERIADLCRQAVTVANPARPGRARDLLRSAAYVAAHTDAHHRPLRTDVVFAAATIENFVAELAGHVPARSAATHASNLHALRDALGLPLDVNRRRFPIDRTGPYGSADIDRFYQQAATLPTEARRRHVTAALDLVFGVGATPTEAVAARPDDITVGDDGTVTATIDGVAVPILADHADGLTRAADAARTAGDQYLLGGREGTRRNRFNQLLEANELGRWGVDVDSTRGRYTWLVAAANDPAYGTFAEFVTVARLRTLTVLDQLLPHITAAAAHVDAFADGDDTDLEVAS